jgi:hypothetical protein
MNYIPLTHKGKTVSTTVGSISHTINVAKMIGATGNKERFIPAGYAHRPDLIANLFLGGPSAWWQVMAINGLFDPFESLKLGDRITLSDG